MKSALKRALKTETYLSEVWKTGFPGGRRRRNLPPAPKGICSVLHALAGLMVTLVDSEYKASIIYLCRDLKTEEDSEEVRSDRDVLLQLLSVPDLPPSLLPPPPGGWTRQENTEWG